jgi:hypothetical protein
MKKKVETKENTKYWEMLCAIDSGISVTKIKSDHVQHMGEMKRTLHTKG